MTVWIWAGLLSLVLSTVLTPVVWRFAMHRQLLDQPDARKVHVQPTPRLGGVAVAVAVAAPLLTLAFLDGVSVEALRTYPGRAIGFGLGAIAMVALGIHDDLRGAGARLKFGVQGLVAVVVWLAGFRIQSIGGSFGLEMPLQWLSLPLTVFWVVGVVNAVNLIDGLDGLASGLALIASVAFFFLGVQRGLVLLPLLMASVAGALVGFLFFNFNPARIFLGDSGSLFLGFVVAVASLWTNMKGATTATLGIIPLLVLVVPLLDTTLAIARRLRRGQSPFSPDREHLHHRLMELGLSHRGAVLALYAVALLAAIAGGATLNGNGLVRAAGVVVAIAVVVVLVRRVGLFGAEAPESAAVLADVARVVDDVQGSAGPQQAWERLAPLWNTVHACGASFVVGTPSSPHSLHWGQHALRDEEDWEDLLLPLRSGAWKGNALVVRWAGRRDPRVRALHRRALRRLRAALEASSSSWPVPAPAAGSATRATPTRRASSMPRREPSSPSTQAS